jgi:hypothetical protein
MPAFIDHAAPRAIMIWMHRSFTIAAAWPCPSVSALDHKVLDFEV